MNHKQYFYKPAFKPLQLDVKTTSSIHQTLKISPSPKSFQHLQSLPMKKNSVLHSKPNKSITNCRTLSTTADSWKSIEQPKKCSELQKNIEQGIYMLSQMKGKNMSIQNQIEETLNQMCLILRDNIKEASLKNSIEFEKQQKETTIRQTSQIIEKQRETIAQLNVHYKMLQVICSQSQ